MDFNREISALFAEQAAVLDMLLQEAVQDGRNTAATQPRIVKIQKNPSGKPLFIIHGTGGQVLFLHALARHMSPLQPLYGIEAAHNPAMTGASQGYGRYVEVLRAMQPQGPYWLGGYSAGCLIAFEVAQQLRQAGEDVAFLLLIDPAAIPALPESETPPTPQQLLRRRFELATLAGVTPLSPEFANIQQVSREMTDLSRHFRAVPLDRRIHVIHSLFGPHAPTAEALRLWAGLAGGGLESASVATDHCGIVQDPHAAITGAQIQHWLDRQQDAPG